MEDSFSLNQGPGDDSRTLCLLCPLLRLHQLHLRSSDIRSRRSRTPVLSDAQVPTSSPGYFLPPSSACVLRRQPVTGPAAVSPLGDRRCNPWGLRGKLKGVVSQGFHRLDPEAARVRQSQPGPGQRRFQLLCVITVNIPEAPTTPHPPPRARLYLQVRGCWEEAEGVCLWLNGPLGTSCSGGCVWGGGARAGGETCPLKSEVFCRLHLPPPDLPPPHPSPSYHSWPHTPGISLLEN